jgi:hypothetical protein
MPSLHLPNFKLIDYREIKLKHDLARYRDLLHASS